MSLGFPYGFYFLTTGAVLYLSEFGLYFVEIGQPASITGITTRFFFLGALFIYVMGGLYRSIGFASGVLPRAKEFNELFIYIAIFFAYAFPSIFLLIQYQYGSPLINGWDRFYYARAIAPPSYSFIHASSISMAAVISYAFYTKRLRKPAVTIWFLITLLGLILASEKYSGFFAIAIFWLPAMIILGRVQIASIKSLAIALAIIAILISLILINYSYTLQTDAFAALLRRAALQGQMSWALDQLAEVGPAPINEVFASVVGWGVDLHEKGMIHLMYLIAPVDLVDRFVDGGVRFTSPFPSNLFYYFGYALAPLILCCIAALPTLFFRVTRTALLRDNFLFYFVAMKANMFVFSGIATGDLWQFFSTKFLIYCFILLIIPLGYYLIERKYAGVDAYAK
ncbi:DUF6418 domain-containing protein [Pusillimonas sp.]|uniref:DUF6418 domain-containing protein n=1 Tax=Pusillimonas sp. TaxID=3040095 RepID=UPI0029B4C9CF|nr:DUF6418 domain-containing protein [Pusillimonas sp.]MDX3895319.1 DUF6418 domain-containing protein [Pusillimonas sp.]